MKVIGYKKVDFVTPEKQTIKGTKVFCTFVDADDKKLVGTASDSFFITDEKAGNWLPKVGDEIDIIYNKYGKIDRVSLIKAA